MKFKSKILICLLLGIMGVNKGQGIKCFVCADGGQLPCQNFEESKNQYIQECESLEKGCFLKVEDNKKTRSCVEKQIDDCKVANRVKYCFCSTDLCNESSSKFISTTDDEDLLEGSGTKMISTTVTDTPNFRIGATGFSNQICRYLLFITLFVLFN